MINDIEKEKVMQYRKKNPDCSYCGHRAQYTPIGKVEECLALRKLCWDSKKLAQKCNLYFPEGY